MKKLACLEMSAGLYGSFQVPPSLNREGSFHFLSQSPCQGSASKWKRETLMPTGFSLDTSVASKVCVCVFQSLKPSICSLRLTAAVCASETTEAVSLSSRNPKVKALSLGGSRLLKAGELCKMCVQPRVLQGTRDEASVGGSVPGELQGGSDIGDGLE